MADDMTDLVAATARRLFEQHCPPEVVRRYHPGQWLDAAWTDVAAAGFPLAMAAPPGASTDTATAAAIIAEAAAAAAPLPVAESMLANHLLAAAGLATAPGPATFAPVRRSQTATLERSADGALRVRGACTGIPWARHCGVAALLADDAGVPVVVRLPLRDVELRPGRTLAGLPSDDLRIDTAVDAVAVGPAPAGVDATWLRARGAALRVIEIAGALERITTLTTGYLDQRIQFGRPLARFQAIQQQMAVLASQAAAAGACAQMAAAAIAGRGPVDVLTIACAKARASEAAGVAAGIAHQVHGAMGFTEEYPLQLLTRRLWAWRDELGAEPEWQSIVGDAAVKAAADGLWAMITGLSARPPEVA